MTNSKTEDQNVAVQDAGQDQPVETVSANTRSYFFPNDGQPFSCEAINLEEAEKQNTQYLKSLKEVS